MTTIKQGDKVTVTFDAGDGAPKPGERLTVAEVRDGKVCVTRKGSSIVRWYPASALTAYTSPKTFDTSEYEAAAGRKPRGEGNWCFVKRSDYATAYGNPLGIEWGKIEQQFGMYSKVKSALPAGDWIVLP